MENLATLFAAPPKPSGSDIFNFSSYWYSVETLLALIGTIIVLFSYVSQTVKTLRIKDATGVSFQTYSIIMISIWFWLPFLAMSRNQLMLIANYVFICVITPMFYYLFKEDRRTQANYKYWFVGLLAVNIGLAIFAGIGMYVDPLRSSLQDLGDVNKVVKYVIQTIAAGILAFAFVPQVIKSIKTGRTRTLSFFLLLLMSLGNVFRVSYWIVLYVNPSRTGIQKLDLSDALPSMIFFGLLVCVATVNLSVKIYFMIREKRQHQETFSESESIFPKDANKNQKSNRGL